MAGEKVGRAVLELTTESGTFFADLGKVRTEFRSVSQVAADLTKEIAKQAAGFFTAQTAYNATRDVLRALVAEFEKLTIGGAAVDDVSQNFERLTAQSGHLGSALLGVLRAGTHNTIDDFRLMKTVNQDLAAGLQLTDGQFSTLAKGAFALAQATGGDVATALETMNDAMVRGQPRTLAALTGKVNLEAAEAKFAKSLGKTKDNLTEEGKIEADRIGILDAVSAATKRLGEQTDGLDERVAQAKTFWANFENELGRTIATSPVIEAGLLGIKDALEQTLGVDQAHLIGAIVVKVDELAIAFVDVAKAGVASAGFIVKEWYAVNKLLGDTAQIVDGVRLALLATRAGVALGLNDIATWKRLDDQMADLELKMLNRGKALKQMDADQAGVDTGTNRYIQTLDKLKATMEAARTTADAHTAATLKVKTAEELAAEAAKRRAELLKLSSAELSEQRRQLEIYGQQFKTWADAIVGVRSQVAGLTDDQKTLIKTGMELGLSVTEITDGLKKQYPALRIGTAAIDAYTTSLKNSTTFLQALSKTNAEVTNSIYQHFRELVEKTQSEQLDLIKALPAARFQAGQIATQTAIHQAEAEIEQAKRTGVAWQQVYAMERQLSLAKLQAAKADAQEEFRIRTQDVRARLAAKPNAIDQAELNAQTAIFQQTIAQMDADFDIGEAQKQDAIRRTYNVWVRAWDQMRSTAEGTIGSVAANFAKMENETVGKLGTILFGFGHDETGDLKRAAADARLQYLHIANSGKATAQELGLAFKRWHEAEDRANYTFGERFKDVWRSIKSTLQDILNDLLKFFVESFLKGMVKALVAQKLGEQLGHILRSGKTSKESPAPTGGVPAGTLVDTGGHGGTLSDLILSIGGPLLIRRALGNGEAGKIFNAAMLGSSVFKLMESIFHPSSPIMTLADTAGHSFADRFTAGFKDVPNAMLRAVLKAAGIFKAIGTMIADLIIKPLTDRLSGGGGGHQWLNAAVNVGSSLLTRGRGGIPGGGGGGGNPWANVAMSALPLLLSHGAPGALPSAAPALAHLAPLLTNPYTLAAVAAVYAGYKLYQHYNKGPHANNARDKFLAQFAAFDSKRDPNNPPGFFGLDALLTKYKHHDWFTALIGAKTPNDVKKAESPIAAFLSTLGRNVKTYATGGFTPPGVKELAMVHGGARGELHIPLDSMRSTGRDVHVYQHNTVTVEASAIDSEGFGKLWDREAVPRLKHEFTFNNNRLASLVKRAIED